MQFLVHVLPASLPLLSHNLVPCLPCEGIAAQALGPEAWSKRPALVFLLLGLEKEMI